MDLNRILGIDNDHMGKDMRPITPEEVVELYRKYGDEISLEIAKEIIGFVSKLAQIAILQTSSDASIPK